MTYHKRSYTFLSPELAEEVVYLHASGLGTRKIAAFLGIARGSVKKVLEAEGNRDGAEPPWYTTD
jgi:hypothetical protein